MSALDVAEPGLAAPRTAEAAAALARRRASSSPRTKRSSSPSLARRRSVRSMKQLLPLALPSNCYVLHAQERPLYAHGTVAIPEPTMDECNFPEMLARDLDISSLVFAAKNMTAGPPSRTLAYEEETWHTPATSPRGLHSPALVPPIVRFKSSNLRDAHEASDHLPDDQVSVSSSSSASGHCFSEVEPVSDARHQSVVTSATSVTGGRNSALSQKRRNSAGHDTNASWIDFEPEFEGAEEVDIRTANIVIPKRPVLQTVVQTDVAAPFPQRAATATGEDGRSSDPFANFSKPASRTWSLQLQNHRPFIPGQPLDSIEIIVPQRRSSLRNQLEGFNPALLGELLTQAQAAEPPSLPPTPIKATPDLAEQEEGTSILSLEDSKNDIQPWFRYVDRDDDDTLGDSSLRPPVEASLPLTPTENVQTWLEDSLESIPLEDQSRRMRLPPEVLDTLRVSTSCFPETMLLCSSLSIETIRSYSRKYKHPAHDGPSRLQTPPPSPKRWRWSNVLGHRRSSTSLRPREQSTLRNLPDNHDAAAPPPTAPAQPPWPRLRNVFPSGADHLLDTLYAHLVAYTYVSSFCPARGAAAAAAAAAAAVSNKSSLSSEFRRPTPRRCSTPDRAAAPPLLESPRKSKDSNNDIPRKAASLLGLQDATGSTVTLHFANASLPPPVHPPVVSHRLLRKRSSFLDNIRASRLPPQPAAESAPLRELQLALGRCIARIVAALRAGVDGDEAILLLADEDPKVAEIDPVLIRTLCEMVRCCEDNVA